MVCTTKDLLEWKGFPKGLKVLVLDKYARSKLEGKDYIDKTYDVILKLPFLANLLNSNNIRSKTGIKSNVSLLYFYLPTELLVIWSPALICTWEHLFDPSMNLRLFIIKYD